MSNTFKASTESVPLVVLLSSSPEPFVVELITKAGFKPPQVANSAEQAVSILLIGDSNDLRKKSRRKKHPEYAVLPLVLLDLYDLKFLLECEKLVLAFNADPVLSNVPVFVLLATPPSCERVQSLVRIADDLIINFIDPLILREKWVQFTFNSSLNPRNDEIKTPLEMMTKALSVLIGSQLSAPVTKRCLNSFLRSLQNNNNIYRPSYESALSSLHLNNESKTWVAREVLLQAPAVAKSFARRRSETLPDTPNPIRFQRKSICVPINPEDLASVPDPLRLAQLRSWSFNVHAFTHESLLSFIIDILSDLDVLDPLGISRNTMVSFLSDVEKIYTSHDNPYHSFRHAFDVTQAGYLLVRMILSQPESTPSVCSTPIRTLKTFKNIPETPLPNRLKNLIQMSDSPSAFSLDSEEFPRLEKKEIFAFILSCICHDLDHDGHTNSFHIRTFSDLAFTYNDQSPQENHHSRKTFELLGKFNILNFSRFIPSVSLDSDLDPENRHYIRRLIVRCILATDLGQHVNVLSRFNEVTPGFDWTNQEHRARVLEMLIKCADVSNVVRPLSIAKIWAFAIQEEMFKQGDKEKALGLSISAFSDRKNPQTANLGFTFSDVMCSPLFKAIANVIPEMDVFLPKISALKDYWYSKIRSCE